MARNITEVRLLNVPLESDYKHTLYFSSKEKQTEYFKSKSKYHDDDFSYVRKEKVLRYPKDYDELLGCNYLMYRNTSYSDKWFYAFITKIEFVSDGISRIYFETDVIQTWLFDYTIKPSFVEREHVTDDSIGRHTLPEGLELGEYVSNWHGKDDKLKDGHKFVFGSTCAVDGPDADNNYSGGQAIKLIGGMYGGIYTGSKYYTYEVNNNARDPISNILQTITDDYGTDAVSCVFMAPKFLCTDSDGNVIKNNSIPNSSSHKYYDHTENKPFNEHGLQGYHPRNKKLFTYPYCYLHVDNGNGGSAIYHYEYFRNDPMEFHVEGVLTPGCSIRMVPLNYKGSNYSDREGLNLGKYPVCNWATDIYTNWVTQNGVNVATSIMTAGGSAITGAMMGSAVPGVGTVAGGVLGALSGLAGVANALNEVHKATMIPPQTEGNINCGDVITAANNNTFHYYHMSIKSEFARIIDDYFDMFGYKINEVRTPHSNHRENWWFTKLIDANIDGAIPMEDMSKIKNCYNTGITFWKNPSNIGNYSVSNGIV